MFDVLKGAIEAPFFPSFDELRFFSFQLKRENWKSKAYLAAAHISFPELRKIQADFLHNNEQAYLNTLLSPRAKDNYLLSRYTAKSLLVKLFPQFLPQAWEIRAGVFKQPIVIGPNKEPLGISISHSQNQCMVLVHPLEHPMAIDLEFSEEHQTETINNEFTLHEKLLLASVNLYNPQGAALLWTCKEAISKIFCTGLMTPLNIYEVCELYAKNSFVECTYSNFEQYKSISWYSSQQVVSIALPRNTLLEKAAFA